MAYTDTTTFNTGATVVAAPRARLTDTGGTVLAAAVSAGWQASTSAAGNTYTFTYDFPDGWRGRIDLLDGTTPVGVSAAVSPPAIDAATVAEIKASAATLAGMTEADGPVRRYTANALEQAPIGGGGGGLTGASSVTLTFTDATPAPIGPIAFTIVGQGSARSSVGGIAAFGLDDGTYTVTAAPKNGVIFPDTTLVVSGTTTLTIAGAAPSIDPPASPSGCTVSIRARTQQLVPQAGVTIGFRYLTIPAGSGMALPVNPLLITTDSNGDATAELLQGATVKRWRGKEPALANSTNTFTVPAASSYELPDLLGEDAT